MVNQLLGASKEREEDEMACLFSDFVDGCLSLPVNFPGFAYHTAMKVTKEQTYIEKTTSILTSIKKRELTEHVLFDNRHGKS